MTYFDYHEVDHDDDVYDEPNDTGCPLCFSDEDEVEWDILFFDNEHTQPVPFGDPSGIDYKWAHCNACNNHFRYVG